MAEEKQDVVRLKTDFYRDGYRKIVLCLGLIIAAIILLIISSIYLYITKPSPVYFSTDKEWRVLPPVSVELPYIATPYLLQWVGDVMMSAFHYDFVNYKDQLQTNRQYFTDQGWLAFEGMLNNYASSDMITKKKFFVNGAADGAPFVVNEGLLDKRYAWWVQIPMRVTYTKADQRNIITTKQMPVFQVLVVRIPTLNNIYGIAIDNIKLLPGQTGTFMSAPNG